MDTIRELAKEKYVELVNAGAQVSPSEFVDYTERLLGEEIGRYAIISWSLADGWISAAYNADRTSIQIMSIIDKYILAMLNGDLGVRVVRDMARILVTLIQALRHPYKGFYASQISMVRDKLYEIIDSFDDYGSPDHASLVSSWISLAKYSISDLGDGLAVVADADNLIFSMLEENEQAA